MSRRLPVVKPKSYPRSRTSRIFHSPHTGSHHILKHPDRPIPRVTVTYHSRDLKRKTLATIIEQAGLSVEEFIDLL